MDTSLLVVSMTVQWAPGLCDVSLNLIGYFQCRLNYVYLTEIVHYYSSPDP